MLEHLRETLRHLGNKNVFHVSVSWHLRVYLTIIWIFLIYTTFFQNNDLEDQSHQLCVQQIRDTGSVQGQPFRVPGEPSADWQAVAAVTAHAPEAPGFAPEAADAPQVAVFYGDAESVAQVTALS